MPKYLFLGSYTAEGASGLRKDGGTKRRQVAEGLVKEAGGKLEAFYFSFGDSDVAIIAELPDSASSVAVSLAVNASGITQIKTIPLITVEEMDVASKKKLDYRPPGH
jgi:uncharacterized protein with GYD domain